MKKLIPLFLLLASPAFADGVMFMNATIPEPAGDMAAGYATIMNHGSTDTAIIGVSSDCCKAVELHESSTDENGVMQMRQMDGLDIPKSSTVVLASGGDHLMLIGLKDELKVGDKVKIVFHFEQGADRVVAFTVVEPTLPDAGASTNHHH